MKQFECGTLVPGCSWHTQAADSAEIVRRAVDHLKSVHGETEVRAEMIERIKARVRDVEVART